MPAEEKISFASSSSLYSTPPPFTFPCVNLDLQSNEILNQNCIWRLRKGNYQANAYCCTNE